MFLRKLVVMVVPLLLAGLLCLAFPLLLQLGFWTHVLMGALLGLSLALLLPLSGASRRREPFAGMLLVPCLVLFALVVVEYLQGRGVTVPVLSVFATGEGAVVLVECAFVAYMLTAVLRTKK